MCEGVEPLPLIYGFGVVPHDVHEADRHGNDIEPLRGAMLNCRSFSSWSFSDVIQWPWGVSPRGFPADNWMLVLARSPLTASMYPIAVGVMVSSAS